MIVQKNLINFIEQMSYFQQKSKTNYTALLLGNEHVSTSMGFSIRTLKKHLPRIKNTFKYTNSNGSLEGSIKKIKLIKCIAYGYRNFQNYKYRILLSFKNK